MVSKTGKAKLGPLTVTQLSKLLESSTKPKEKAKIQRALNKRPPALAPIAEPVSA
jgi:hypothetical protein